MARSAARWSRPGGGGHRKARGDAREFEWRAKERFADIPSFQRVVFTPATLLPAGVEPYCVQCASEIAEFRGQYTTGSHSLAIGQDFVHHRKAVAPAQILVKINVSGK